MGGGDPPLRLCNDHRFGLLNADPHPGDYVFHDDGA